MDNTSGSHPIALVTGATRGLGAAIAAALKAVLGAHGLKMPQLAMPVRVLVMGTAQTPSLDAVLELQNKQTILQRLQNR